MQKFYFIILGLLISIFSFGQIPILEEGFEDVNNPTGWSTDGVLQWYYDAMGMDVSWVDPQKPFSGQMNALLQSNHTGMSYSTKLISPELDLSNNYNAVLNFHYAQPATWSGNDILTVYYRTSNTSTWQKLITYPAGVNIWTKATINLPNLSSTYYIAIEGNLRNGIGVAIDEVKVTAMVKSGLDIKMVGIESPEIWNEKKQNELKVRIANWSHDSICKVNIGYRIDNGTPVIINGVTLSNPLYCGNYYDYTFSPISVSKGSHSISTWVNYPNGKNDDNIHNDTFYQTFGTALNDTLIIDKNGNGDYLDFKSAIADLVKCGISSDVIFEVKAGNYFERVEIPYIKVSPLPSRSLRQLKKCRPSPHEKELYKIRDVPDHRILARKQAITEGIL